MKYISRDELPHYEGLLILKMDLSKIKVVSFHEFFSASIAKLTSTLARLNFWEWVSQDNKCPHKNIRNFNGNRFISRLAITIA